MPHFVDKEKDPGQLRGVPLTCRPVSGGHPAPSRFLRYQPMYWHTGGTLTHNHNSAILSRGSGSFFSKHTKIKGQLLFGTLTQWSHFRFSILITHRKRDAGRGCSEYEGQSLSWGQQELPYLDRSGKFKQSSAFCQNFHQLSLIEITFHPSITISLKGRTFWGGGN